MNVRHLAGPHRAATAVLPAAFLACALAVAPLTGLLPAGGPASAAVGNGRQAPPPDGADAPDGIDWPRTIAIDWPRSDAIDQSRTDAIDWPRSGQPVAPDGTLPA